MKSAEIPTPFEEKGIHVFTFNDAVRISGRGRAYVRLMLFRMIKRGELQRAERGVYYTKKADPLEVASNISHPSYVSLMAALNYHGVTTQMPIVIDIVTSKRHRPIALEGIRSNRIVFRTLDRRKIFGFYRDRNNINVAELEKALVDSLYLGRPGAGEVSGALENALRTGKVDRTKLNEYAKAMGSKVLLRRLDSMLGNVTDKESQGRG
jgi:predicted transcriptional regulator of viral defense system